MKKHLDFNIRNNSMSPLNFIQRFVCVYMFLEKIDGSGGVFCKPGVPCCGCNGLICKKVTAINRQSSYFYFFEAFTGHSAIRCRFDGAPTEMQKLIGCSSDEISECGGGFTIDFLYGFACYDYRVCTAGTKFKREIAASIDAGIPVIAKVKSGSPRYYIISGYDGEKLLCPDLSIVTYTLGKNVISETPEKASDYGNIESLIITGGKIKKRYSLKDGLENIRRVMECNINERIWNDCLAEIGGLDKMDPAEKQARLKRVREMFSISYNAWNFRKAFNDCNHKKLEHIDLIDEMRRPELLPLWKNINRQGSVVVNNAHSVMRLKIARENMDAEELRALIKPVSALIEKTQKADLKMLELIKKAETVL